MSRLFLFSLDVFATLNFNALVKIYLNTHTFLHSNYFGLSFLCSTNVVSYMEKFGWTMGKDFCRFQ